MTPQPSRSLMPVALCIPEDDDADILTLLEEHSRILKVVRRCADLVELEAAAEVGVAQIGVLSATDPDCDIHYIERLHKAGMRVILLQDYTPAGEAIGTQSLIELGADLLAPAHDPTAIVRALLSLAHPQSAERTQIVPAMQEETLSEGEHSSQPSSTVVASIEPSGEDNDTTSYGGKSIGTNGCDALPECEAVDLVNDTDTEYPAVGADGTGGTENVGGTARIENPKKSEGAGEEKHPSPLNVSDHAWLNSRHRHSPRGSVIAVWGTSGAPGRTTTAVNLAAALQCQPGIPRPQVILIDADTYAPSIAHALGMGTEASSLSAIARYAARGELHAEHIEQALQQSDDGINVITGLSSPHRWREAAPSTLTQCIRAARECADYVIVDVASGTLDPLDEFGRFYAGRDEGIAAVLRAADIVTLVARSDAEGLHRLMYALEWFHTHISGPKLRIVANMACEERAGSRPAQAIAHALAPYLPGEDISLVAQDPQVLKAQLQGRSLVSAAPTSPAGEAFTELAGSVLKLAARTEDTTTQTSSSSGHGRHRKTRSPRVFSLAQRIGKRRKAQTRDGS